jgi:SPP1 gp7 family putative phage head morphogenesis protein
VKVTARKPGKAPAEVRRYLEGKGLTPSWDWDDVWQEEHSAAFTAAKAMGKDVLAALRDAVHAAIEEGQTFDDFKKRVRDVLAALGWWGVKTRTNPKTGEKERVELGTPRRLRTIYVTNARVARAQGQWARIQRTKELRPYLIYELGPSAVHRKEHEAWAGLILEVDDPAWGKMFPPNGWGCRCRVRQLSEAEANRKGGVSEAPSDLGSIDPEWAYNPGEAGRRAG